MYLLALLGFSFLVGMLFHVVALFQWEWTCFISIQFSSGYAIPCTCFIMISFPVGMLFHSGFMYLLYYDQFSSGYAIPCTGFIRIQSSSWYAIPCICLSMYLHN